MKVSYYELLGMIKDGKSPEKVVYKDNSYLWDGNNYCSDHCNFMVNYFNEADMFDKNITILGPSEIIEEDKEIEELEPELECVRDELNPIPYERKRYNISELGDKLNEVIRKINKIEKEGK